MNTVLERDRVDRLRDLLRADGILATRARDRRLVGVPDLVFQKARLVVFIDSCFWQRCPEHYRATTRNTSRLRSKVAASWRRALEEEIALVDAGWKVARFWEHDLDDELASRAVVERIRRLLEATH